MPPATLNDVEAVRRGLATGKYDGARGYYAPALRLALILLGEHGFKQGSAEELRAEAVLFNSATVFEGFVRQKLRQRYQRLGLSVRKGFFPPKTLFEDGTLKLDPDIVIARREKLLLLGDVKYKIDGVDAGDVYQAHAYAQMAKLHQFVFFLADASSQTSKTTERESYLGLQIVELKVPLGDLDAAARTLSTLERQIPGIELLS